MSLLFLVYRIMSLLFLVYRIIHPQNRSGEPIINPHGRYLVSFNLNGCRRKVRTAFISSLYLSCSLYPPQPPTHLLSLSLPLSLSHPLSLSLLQHCNDTRWSWTIVCLWVSTVNCSAPIPVMQMNSGSASSRKLT